MIMSKLNKQNKILGLYSNSKLQYAYATSVKQHIYNICFILRSFFFQYNKSIVYNSTTISIYSCFFQNLHRNYKCIRRFAVLICNQQNTQHNVYCMIYFVLYIRNYSAFFVFKYCTNSHLKYSFSFDSFCKIIFNCSKKYIKIPI